MIMNPGRRSASASKQIPPTSVANTRSRNGINTLLALGISILLTASQAFGATLTRLETTGPRPSKRSSPAVATIDHDIYVFGGVFDNFDTDENLFHDDLYRFVSSRSRWERIETTGPRPEARAFAATAADPAGGGRFYVYGGSTYGPYFQDFIAYDDLWVYSVRENKWSEIVPLNDGPSGRSRPSTWIVGNKFYVFGGVGNDFATLNDLWALDLKTREWTELIANGEAGSPPPRHEAQQGLRFRHGKLVIYGGETINYITGEFGLLNDTWEYDILNNEWTEVSTDAMDSPALPRNYAVAGILGNALYVHGGDIPGGSDGCGAPFPQNVTDEIWKFDLATKVWSSVSATGDAPLRLKRHRGVEVGNRLFFFSGYDFQCNDGDGPGQIWNLDVYTLEP
ncbi:Kelch repeat-containing protein [Verrucomicrobiota bacterium sgz303538]